MKQLLLIYLTLIHISTMSAQDDAYFTIITIRGEVQYESPSGDMSDVVPGSKLPIEGRLHVQESSMIKLISEQRPQKLQTKGVYDLKELYFASDKSSMSFTGKFWRYLTEGLKSTDTKKDIRAYGSKLVAGGIKGFNKAEQGAIELLSPIVGEVALSDLTFRWAPSQDGQEYQLSIKNSAGDMVLQKISSTGSTTVQLASNGLSEGLYYWHVSNTEGKSGPIAFNYVPSFDITARLSRITDYVEGDDTEKLWIKAVVLDMEGHHYEASLILEALKEQHPDQLLFNRLYALNQARLGNIDRAADMID